MNKIPGALFGNFRSLHESNGAALIWTGAVGFLAFPAFYLLRFTGSLPHRYDDLELRLVATVLCGGLAARNWWPAQTRRFYLAYSYLVIWYCFAFLLSFTLLQNGGTMNTVVNVMLGCTIVILLTDWRNALVILLTGYAFSVIIYWITNPAPQLSAEFLFWWLPLCGLLIAAGGISRLIDRRAEFERMRQLYNGLAGSIAHEMRTPLMQLRHALDVLDATLPSDNGRGLVCCTPEQATLFAQTVAGAHNAVSRGLQSIDVTLRQLKPNAFDTLSFRFLSAQDCVRKAVNEFAYDHPDQREKVSIHVRWDFSFRGDETVFLMIVFNLLKNALYYLPLRPQANIRVEVDGGAAEWGGQPEYRVVVRDTGPGIAPERVARLFQDFQTSGKAEGTGLGLAFCMRAMKAFGGNIRCESVPGEVTEFTLAFPIARQAEIETWQQEVITHANRLLSGKRVLVVDDEPLMRHATLLKLPSDCIVVEAHDGAEALAALSRADYDLVIMDIRMPGMDGYEATRRIRRGDVPGREGVPILGHSSNAASLAVARGRQAGFNGFLSKPCSLQEMASAITPLLTNAPMRTLARPAQSLTGRTILLADDSALNRAVVKAGLQEMGMRVIEAEHGHAVLHLLQVGARPDAILMDMNMPGMDGLEATRAVRAMSPPMADIPVLALTALSLEEDVKAALDAGMNGFLVKPLDIPLLRQELQRVLMGQAVAQQSPMQQPAVQYAPALLDKARVDGFRRQGLQDLLPRFIDEINRLVHEMNSSTASRDVKAFHEALHSLVGASGEAGAKALHELTRTLHDCLDGSGWPEDAGWLAGMNELARRTEKELRACSAPNT